MRFLIQKSLAYFDPNFNLNCKICNFAFNARDGLFIVPLGTYTVPNVWVCSQLCADTFILQNM